MIRLHGMQLLKKNRGQHQHALLSIANFHYSTGGLDAARAAIDEAIRVARAEGDKACLRHCIRCVSIERWLLIGLASHLG